VVDAIRDIINSAESDLVLSTYSIVQMQAKAHLLVEHIKRAVTRGVQVRLFVRQRNAWPDQMDELLGLHDAGVKIYADLRNHAKVAIADRSRAMLFSANFDGNHGLDSGVEVGYRLKEPDAIDELVRYIDHAITNADARFYRDPVLAELDGRLAARWCKSWARGTRIKVACDSAAFSRLAKESHAGPCLYEELAGDSVRLFVGGVVVEGKYEGEMLAGTVSPSSAGSTASDRLKEWMRSPRSRTDNVTLARGFFGGTLEHVRYGSGSDGL
jgi:hypothetical protein